MIESNKLYTDIYAFSQEIIAENVRNLDLLKDTVPTLSQLGRMAAQMTADTAFAGKAIIAIQELNIQIDADGAISGKLQQAQSYTNQLCDALGQMCSMTQQNGSMAENSTEQAFTHAITAADNLHNILGLLQISVSEPIQTPEEIVTKFFVV